MSIAARSKGEMTLNDVIANKKRIMVRGVQTVRTRLVPIRTVLRVILHCVPSYLF